MEKIKQRKGLVAVMVLAAVLLYGSGYLLWDGLTHVGPGVWHYGGEKYGGRLQEDEYEAVIPERQYKRQCCVAAFALSLAGVTFLWGAIDAWKKRNKPHE